MKIPRTLVVKLLSDTTFGSGRGTPGMVDVEVDHDEMGLPFLGGKALRALLRDSWLSMQRVFPELFPAACRAFGKPGDMDDGAILRVGNAVVDSETREWVRAALERDTNPVSAKDVFGALTAIRRQTAMDRETGAPAETTLRATRVVIRGLELQAPLTWLDEPAEAEVRCLALAVLATRHAGLGRNRGRGHIAVSLAGDRDYTVRVARGVSP